MKKFRQKRSLKVAIIWLICLVMVSSFFVPVFAWFAGNLTTNVVVDSRIVGSYFEQGNGTAETPYVIARPIQMYYFAWLQNLGYFDDANPASTTSDTRYHFTLGADIDMNDNVDYSVLPPIGTPDHPFTGVFDGKYHFAPTDTNGDPVTDPFDPDNTKEGTYHIISNLKINNANLSNIPNNGEAGMQFIGLFGVIGSITDVSITGEVKNFGLYNMTIETRNPDDNKTIIGIVAGYCNGVLEGIGVSDCSVKVKNGVTPVSVTTHTTNDDTGEITSSVVTPETISFSLVGFSDKTYQAYNLSPIAAGGDEFGGSLAMESVFNKITAVKNDQDASHLTYYIEKQVNIDEHGGRTESYSNAVELDYHREMANRTNFYYLTEYEETNGDGEVTESYSVVDRYSNSSKVLITDGLGNYLRGVYSGNTYSIQNTRDRSLATEWTLTAYNSYYRISSSINNSTRYIYYSNGNLSLSTSTYSWSITNTDVDFQDYLVKTNSGNNYICYDDGWKMTSTSTPIHFNNIVGSAVTQYLYLNGGKTLQKDQLVTTTTRTEYDAYLIQDGNGNYLVGSPSGISMTTSSGSATAWRFSNGASGGTFTIQDDNEVVYYLYNNNGTLQISQQNSTNWTVSNGQITNGGYYLVYLDGSWKLWQETTYYSIDDGNGTYLNYTNSALSGGNSSTTRWHIDNNNKIYFYNGTTKTYLYNNNGTLTTTTTVGTANAWTINNTNHTISNNNYYLMYIDGAWKLLAETSYFTIDDGNGTYLNYSNSALSGGNSSTTRWHIDNNNKVYTYNGTQKVYLYNNNGTLTTTTTVGTANAWTIANNTIKSGNYYLAYIDGAWKMWENTKYYAINNGNGVYLNLTNGNIVSGASSTRWHFSNGDNGGQIYTFVNNTKTYLRDNNGTLETTTTQGNATTWTVDSNTHSITSSNNRYLCYNDSAWGLTEESEYFLFDDNHGVYLNLTNGNIASGASSTRWYKDNSNRIYAYNGTTKTYLRDNNGTLETTTTVGSATTWTIDSNNNNITSSNGRYLCYNDGAWGLKEEAGYYFINNGSSAYLNLTNGNLENGTAQTATRWYKDANNKIYAYNGTTKTYLYNNGGLLTTTTTVGTASAWTIANNTIKNGDYYLIYQNGWKLSQETTYTLISDGNGNYFNYENSEFVVGTAQTATEWHNSNGKLYTYVNGTATYLVNNNGALATTTNSGSATTWTIANNTIKNGDYYLIYQNGWLLTDEDGYYLISDGSGHYFNLTSSGFEIGTSQTAVGWHFSNGASGGRIYTYVNGTRTYLVNNSGVLSTTTTQGSATSWTVSNNQIYNNGYYLVYKSTGWKLTNVSSYYTLCDEEGNYLNLTSSGYSVGDIDNATDWQITNTSSGQIYTYINGTATYMRNNNGTLTTTTTQGSATTWTINNTAKTITNGGYYLICKNNTWQLTNTPQYYISDNNGHYLNLNQSTQLTEVGTSDNATLWTFTSTSSNYYISTAVGNSTYYLNFDSENMVPGTTRSTAWTVSTANNTISCNDAGNTAYYMFYDGACWTLVRNGVNSYYLISDGTNYLTFTLGTGNNPSATIANTTVRSYAKKWVYSSNKLSVTLRAGNNNRTYNVYTNRSNLSLSTNNSTNWTINTSNKQVYYAYSGWFSSANYYIRYDNGWSITTTSTALNGLANINSSTKTAVRTVQKMVGYTTGSYNYTNSISSNSYNVTVSMSTNNYTLTANAPYTAYNLTTNSNSTSYSLTANTSSTNYNVTANRSDSNYNITANMTSYNYDITDQTEATTVVWKNTVQTVETVEVKGKETYIPLATNDDGTTSLRNTGYIVSGSNYALKETYSGDIRVSYYAMSNLYKALGYSSSDNFGSYSASRLEIVTRTYLSNGFVRISDTYNANNSNVNSTLSSAFPTKSNVTTLGLEKYTDSRDQLEDTLSGSSNVYGLHFMDAQININNLANIEKATINGSTYSNYKMPQDCIDFNLNTRGSLNFYAGTYFPGNTAFFSLHQIVRSDGEIVAINEISKIYGDPTNSAKRYIYEYVGGSTPTLPSGYVLMFDTTWIKSPTMQEYAMYYFEIPVNAGEYALGSVSGADGAYLIYLDIGASQKALGDGTTLETSIKGVDFVTYTSLGANSIASTLGAITRSDNSSAVIVLKTRFQGEISFTIQDVVVDDVNMLRIGYTLSDTSSKDYVKWTKVSTDVDVVDNTEYS